LPAYIGNLLNPAADNFRPHFRPSKEGGEEFPDSGFSKDQSDADQDARPCCERANASEQVRSAATSNASNAAAVGREDDLNERKQADKCEQ